MKIRFFWKIRRPIQLLTVFMGTWCIAFLSSAPPGSRLSVSVVMAFCCLGASLFHYGAAKKMYARKSWDLVEVRHPVFLVAVGLLVFIGAILIAWQRLPRWSLAIICFDVAAIVLYAQALSRRWFTKNMIIALVCITPILMGHMVGSRTHPALYGVIAAVFCAYYAREILKDIQDIRANEGIRVTLPMVIGTPGAFRLAGVLLLASAVSTSFLIPHAWGVSVTTFIFGIFALRLLFGKSAGGVHQAITLGIAALVLAFSPIVTVR